MKRVVDIVVPVYDGFDETINCIESVLASDLGQDVYLNVINDASPNKKLTEWLRDASKHHHFFLYENEENLGFVQTVNHGMSLHEDRDVILLNSDTLVAGDWVQRLREHVVQGTRISSVTPFSNNATICSFPNFCKENELLPFPVKLIDQAFAKANAGASEEIPTAIGFCMYITRDSLNDVGTFDAATYGKGYGEENDFCMRAFRSGWKHIVATDVFVAHIGGVSFSVEKNARVEEAQRILDRLYPEYHHKVNQFVTKDPLLPYRVKAYVELIQALSKKTVLLITHNLGGGVEKYTKELDTFFGMDVLFPVLRPSGEPNVVALSLSPMCDDKLLFRLPQDYQKLLSFCRMIGVGHVYVQHTMGVPGELLYIAGDLSCSMDFMIHDYYLINANPTLTSKDGVFCEDLENRDECCGTHYEIPFNISPQQWREGQVNFLDRCRYIIAPSNYTADLFSSYFKKYDIQVVYHPDSVFQSYPSPSAPHQNKGQAFKVLILGAISKEKGADVLEATALEAKNQGMDIQFHLLGYSYRPLDGGIIEYGAYCSEEVSDKIDAIQPNLIWFPALWPETYSYTLSEALRSGYPILASDLGSFPERLQGREYSWVSHWGSSPEAWLAIINNIASGYESQPQGSKIWRDIYHASKEFYTAVWSQVECIQVTSCELDTSLLYREPIQLSRKERLLLRLVQYRQMRGLRTIVRKTPQPLKNKLRTFLSKRTLHDLLIGKK